MKDTILQTEDFLPVTVKEFRQEARHIFWKVKAENYLNLLGNIKCMAKQLEMNDLSTKKNCSVSFIFI